MIFSVGIVQGKESTSAQYLNGILTPNKTVQVWLFSSLRRSTSLYCPICSVQKFRDYVVKEHHILIEVKWHEILPVDSASRLTTFPIPEVLIISVAGCFSINFPKIIVFSLASVEEDSNLFLYVWRSSKTTTPLSSDNLMRRKKVSFWMPLIKSYYWRVYLVCFL